MHKVVLVTGGTSGIGLAIAKKFLSDGYCVVVAARTEKNVAELKTLGEAEYIECDIARRDDCRKAVEFAVSRFGALDILVNNAGTTGQRKTFIDADLDDVEKVIDVNLKGTIFMSYYASRVMAEKGSGIIVNIGSLVGFIANSESVGYISSKGGVRLATSAMAKDLAPYGIRVVSVAPGWVNTGLMDQKAKDYGGTMHLRGKILEPEEIADVVWLMTRDEAVAINGTTVMADDGYTSFKGFKIHKKEE